MSAVLQAYSLSLSHQGPLDVQKNGSRDFPGGQWLRLHGSSAGAQVWSLVGELRSCMPHSQKQSETNRKDGSR